jgi:hypothetical protein
LNHRCSIAQGTVDAALAKVAKRLPAQVQRGLYAGDPIKDGVVYRPEELYRELGIAPR